MREDLREDKLMMIANGDKDGLRASGHGRHVRSAGPNDNVQKPNMAGDKVSSGVTKVCMRSFAGYIQANQLTEMQLVDVTCYIIQGNAFCI